MLQGQCASCSLALTLGPGLWPPAGALPAATVSALSPKSTAGVRSCSQVGEGWEQAVVGRQLVSHVGGWSGQYLV